MEFASVLSASNLMPLPPACLKGGSFPRRRLCRKVVVACFRTGNLRRFLRARATDEEPARVQVALSGAQARVSLVDRLCDDSPE